jgi:hypothetical protein
VYLNDANNVYVAACGQVVLLKLTVATSGPELGKHLHEVRTSGLWKARRGRDGEQKFKTFSQYCGAELGMAEANAVGLIAGR